MPIHVIAKGGPARDDGAQVKQRINPYVELVRVRFEGYACTVPIPAGAALDYLINQDAVSRA
ncbi:MAG: hypothetical protein HY804_06165 [Nitrospinae bacterium]|nr:hypothetical protein [Nitrospinota bacterium]